MSSSPHNIGVEIAHLLITAQMRRIEREKKASTEGIRQDSSVEAGTTQSQSSDRQPVNDSTRRATKQTAGAR